MNAKRVSDPRARAATVLAHVLKNGRSLRSATITGTDNDGLAMELVYGVLRWYWTLTFAVDQHLEKPLKHKDIEIYYLLLIGAYQFKHLRIPEHAAVSETVSACEALSRPWAKRLVNGVLRNLQRHGSNELVPEENLEATWSCPLWLIEHAREDWPDHWTTILKQGNERPPMTLRVNTLRHTRDRYLQMLADEEIDAQIDKDFKDAVSIDNPVKVDRLPGFQAGAVSVQDVSAQLVADLVAPKAGERILDACAAPGGKAAHLLERCPDLNELIAMDVDEERVALLRGTLERLHSRGSEKRFATQIADARTPKAWFRGNLFDKILVDAPCSGSGVVSRHPDIKHLRKYTDIEPLAETQDEILDALWPLIRTGGRLFYVTCSILRAENEHRLLRFTEKHPDGRAIDPGEEYGAVAGPGRQRLPGIHRGDGFFYGVIEKT